MGRAVMKHLKCYGKHMVVKHLAVLQYFSGRGTSQTVTHEGSTKHVLAGHPLRLNKCSKHVEGINHNKLKANGACCWSYY
jgi:hypothetical protein